jgi:hypothetical protein
MNQHNRKYFTKPLKKAITCHAKMAPKMLNVTRALPISYNFNLNPMFLKSDITVTVADNYLFMQKEPNSTVGLPFRGTDLCHRHRPGLRHFYRSSSGTVGNGNKKKKEY